MNHGQSGMRPGCDLVVAVNVQQLLDAEMPLYKSTSVGSIWWARTFHRSFCTMYTGLVDLMTTG